MIQTPLEQRTFWIQWYDGAIPPGGADIDIPVNRNIELEGFGGGREDSLLLFQLFVVWSNGQTNRLIPRESTIANEDYIPLPTVAEYWTRSFSEVPMSTWKGCDVAAIRVRALSMAAVNKVARGHIRGKIYG